MTKYPVVRVDQMTYRAITAIAEAEDRTQNAIVRRALTVYLELAAPEIRHLAQSVAGPEPPRYARKNSTPAEPGVRQ